MNKSIACAEDCSVLIASEEHRRFAPAVCALLATAAKARGTGIARRRPDYIESKMREGKAIIALYPVGSEGEARLAGFCYVETWSDKRYVANSGLVVASEFRKSGLAKRIKQHAFALSRARFPQARIFGITTSHAVMKINSQLGYTPVPFAELTDDEEFWQGCNSCPNVDILQRTQRRMCLCTAMLFEPQSQERPAVQSNKASEAAEAIIHLTNEADDNNER